MSTGIRILVRKSSHAGRQRSLRIGFSTSVGWQPHSTCRDLSPEIPVFFYCRKKVYQLPVKVQGPPNHNSGQNCSQFWAAQTNYFSLNQPLSKKGQSRASSVSLPCFLHVCPVSAPCKRHDFCLDYPVQLQFSNYNISNNVILVPITLRLKHFTPQVIQELLKVVLSN